MVSKEEVEKGGRELLSEIQRKGVISEKCAEAMDRYSDLVVMAANELFTVLSEQIQDEEAADVIVQSWIRLTAGSVAYLLREAKRIEQLYNAPKRVALLVAHEHMLKASVVELISCFVENEITFFTILEERKRQSENNKLYR